MGTKIRYNYGNSYFNMKPSFWLLKTDIKRLHLACQISAGGSYRLISKELLVFAFFMPISYYSHQLRIRTDATDVDTRLAGCCILQGTINVSLAGKREFCLTLFHIGISGCRFHGTQTHLTICFPTFSSTLDCTDIPSLSFCGKSLCVSVFLGTRTSLQVFGNETRNWHPYFRSTLSVALINFKQSS